LLRQDWRTSINRFAEAMTIFAVMCAGMFPLLHLGRPWVFYWLFPYPNPMLMWPQFRSPLVWDVFAVSTYFTVSLIFWYVGLVPDLATLRDRARSRVGRLVYGLFALGWTGAARHWARYKVAYLLLAGLAAPLVVSVHSIVGMDFAAAQVPGWHSTIFPPYFVAGAIYSGFAMVLTLAIPLRAVYHLQDFITDKHIENCGKLMLITGLIVGYGYACEGFMSWWSGNPFEQYLAVNRAFGPYAIAYWYGMVAFNFMLPHVLWSKTVRTSVPVMFAVSILVNFGMWMERFVIVVGSLHRDFMPSMWSMFYPTIWDWAILAGTLAFFTFCFLLFMKFLPVISISEMRELVHVQQEELEGRKHPHHKPGVSGKLPEELPPGLEGAT
jgi:molybdopterin-containing oxidoreductase family membrane subunit